MRSRWLLLVPFILVLALVASLTTRVAPTAAAVSTAAEADLSIPYGSSGWRYKVGVLTITLPDVPGPTHA